MKDRWIQLLERLIGFIDRLTKHILSLRAGWSLYSRATP